MQGFLVQVWIIFGRYWYAVGGRTRFVRFPLAALDNLRVHISLQGMVFSKSFLHVEGAPAQFNSTRERG